MTDFELTVSILLGFTVGVWTVLLWSIWSAIKELTELTDYWFEEIARKL